MENLENVYSACNSNYMQYEFQSSKKSNVIIGIN